LKIQAAFNTLTTFLKDNYLPILLILAFINGLIFIFLIPPWMHYDEPGHFEYTWMAANAPRWPEEGEYNQSMRRETAASMIENGFMNYPSVILLQIKSPISLITNQTGDVPIYYFLASLPLRLVRHSDITFQLYLTRFFTFSLFLVTIWICYQTCQDLFGRAHPLTWMTPLFLINLPSFVDIMTAANNDGMAIAAMSLFIWFSLRVIQNGLTLRGGLMLALSLILCALSKSTAFLAIPLSLVVILLSIIKKQHLKYLMGGVILGGLIGIFLLFSWQTKTPAFFYGSAETMPEQVQDDAAPLGEKAIVQSGQPHKWRFFYHAISQDANQALLGNEITLGAWIWAEQSTTLAFPVIINVFSEHEIVFNADSIELTNSPQFFAFTTKFPESLPRGNSIRFFASNDENNRVYWDGLVLLPEAIQTKNPPEFLDPHGNQLRWQGQTYTNLIRNASGEKTWPVFSRIAKKIIPSQLGFSASALLGITDFKSNLWYYDIFLPRFFRSFWGIFGWSQVTMAGKKPYQFFAVLTALMVLGMVVGGFQKAVHFPGKATLFLWLAFIGQFFLVIIRGFESWYANVLIPLARYFYPAVIPLVLLLTWGTNELFLFVEKKTGVSAQLMRILYSIVFLGIFLWGVFSNVVYYQ
jgi:hypothetical protein